MSKKRPRPGHRPDAPENSPPATDDAVAENAAVPGATAAGAAAEESATQPAGDPSVGEAASADCGEKGPTVDLPDQLLTELEQAKDRALRSQAELENYRKRVARQSQQERRYAHLPLMRDLLPVLDNMERAIEAVEKTHDTASLLEGVKLVAQQLQDVLGRHHCAQIEALNEPFDPHLHEAISQQPSDEHPANTVLQVTQTGFLLHDRVVRPSQVIVSTTNQQNQ